jgi:hypothetical protein
MAYSVARTALEIMSFDPCTPQELEQRRIDRLRELRAIVDALRCERETADPLLAWVRDQEHRDSGNR